MDIVISETSDKPIYQQIAEQISSQIVRGELPGGECLPPIRTVARELRISVITVKKAWEELEHEGLIHTMAGKGCFVAKLPPALLTAKRREMAEEQLHVDLSYYKMLGISQEELVDLIQRNFPLEKPAKQK
jgi:GntR family transcriptional regulator